jgi:hypothetical protein
LILKFFEKHIFVFHFYPIGEKKMAEFVQAFNFTAGYCAPEKMRTAGVERSVN